MPGLQALAIRAGQGDAVAMAELRRQLEGSMNRIVRRALREESETSALGKRILAVAERAPTARRDRDGRALADWVSGRICDSVYGNLRVFSPATDTVRD